MVNMKQKLLDIIQNSKTNKHVYNVKQHPEIYNWVLEETKNEPENISFLARIYMILNNESSICPLNNIKKFSGNLNVGFMFCGRATSCECARKNQSEKNSNAKQLMTDEEIKISNEKRKETVFKKTGYKFNSQNPEIKEKKKQTFLEKYGVMTSLLHNETKQKIKKTLLKNYDVDHPSKSSIIIEKRNKTNLQKYGNICSAQNEKTKEVWQKRHQEKYGVKNFHKNHFTEEQQEILSSRERFEKEFNELGIYNLSKKYNLSLMVLELRLNIWNIPYEKRITSIESFIKNILEKNNIDYIYRDRKLIRPLELDFYIPSKKIAIEVGGLYWHSEKFCNKNYHLNKLIQCENQGIRLLTIFSDEICEKSEIVENKILHLLGKSKKSRFGARKCKIQEITSDQSKDFLKKNHIQGSSKSKINLGAFYNGELVSVMTFSPNRNFTQDKSEYIELVRFASSENIPGISSKLFSYFIKMYKPTRVISYADRRWSQGNLYEKIGFSLLKSSKPNYWYSSDFLKREHRYNYTKHLLVKKGNDSKLSESEIMRSLGYGKIWDCGTLRYEWMCPDLGKYKKN
jgi:very-short-patch-repair endonuclease